MTLIYISVILSASIWLYLIYRYDRFEPEPVRCVLLVGAAGGLLSGIPSALLNTFAASFSGAGGFIYNGTVTGAPGGVMLLFSLFVGFNEEIWKSFIAVVILKRLREFNEPIDALIYSMSLALGFAAFENISYTVAGGYEVLIIRSFTAVPLHAGLAAVWGSGIAKARYLNGERYLHTLVPYVAAASLLHAFYNYMQFVYYDNPVSVIIALIFAFFIVSYAAGRLRYFQKESPFREPGICPQCGTSNSSFARYCINCGSYIVTDYFNSCVSCGARNRIGASSCKNCGEAV